MKIVHQPRILGIETEYAFLSKEIRRDNVDPALNPDLFFSMFPRTRLFTHSSQNVFIENGARVYLDTGYHPEYATPECQNVTTLILYDKVGERMMERAETLLNQCWRDRDLRAWLVNAPEIVPKSSASPSLRFDWSAFPVSIFRNNLSTNALAESGDPVSWGCHENYLISRTMAERVMHLVPHLVTRQIYGGAGWLSRNTHSVVRYMLAQRPPVIFTLLGNGTTGRHRPIIHMKDETLANSDKWKRLHIILGDSNISPWSSWLKIKVTSLIIDMLEDDTFSNGIDFHLAVDAVEIFKDICFDLSFSRAFTFGSKTHTAVSLQRFYLDLVRKFYAEGRRALDEEGGRAIELWQAVIDCIDQGDFDTLAPFFDNFGKLWLLNSGILHKGGMPPRPGKEFPFQNRQMPENLFYYLKSVDLAYHRVLEEKSCYRAFQKTVQCRDLASNLARIVPWISKPLFTQEVMDEAWFRPPPGRAQWRNACSRYAEALEMYEPLAGITLDWTHAMVQRPDTSMTETFRNLDPYSEMTPDLSDAMRRIGMVK